MNGGHFGGRRGPGLVAVAGLAMSVGTAAAQELNLPGAESGQPVLLDPTAGQPVAPTPGTAGTYTIPAFAEGVELRELVDYVVNTLRINVIVDPTLAGTVVINRPITVERDQLLVLLNDLLEQQNFMIYQERGGWYQIRPITGETIVPSESTTRLIPTPNMRPSSLRPAVEAMLPPSRSTTTRVVYLDDLGLIMITDTPRVVASVELIIEQIRQEMDQLAWHRIELKNIAAPAALDRAIEMVGGTPSTGQPDPMAGQFPGQFPQPGGEAGGPTGSRTAALITNIESRLRVDVGGNALVFYGRQSELEMIRQIIAQIDVATRLEARQYEAGAYAEQIANLARAQGLGEVIVIEQEQENQNQFFPQFGGQFGQQQQAPQSGGSQMIVDAERGKIVYFGTPEQHDILDALIQNIGLEGEAITIRAYPLQNADAEEMADLLRQLILGQSPEGEGGLLPTGGEAQPVFNPFTGILQSPESGPSLFGDEYTSIVADIPNNQVLVRAQANLQPSYERLITDLDMRRQQVYIKAHIVAINNTDTSRLAFETQLINATGDPVFQTNFGLNRAGPGTDILDPRDPLATLTGLTTAVIRSEYVPIIIHATATDIDARIVASPQLLVNDNFEATIESIDQQPTTTTTQTTGNPAQTSFGGYEDAGTTLTVTPSISSNGWIRMEYEITLSSFTGLSSTDGVPPPRQNNTLVSEAVTVPSDATIVVGGIVVENSRDTVVKIPLLGDIPVLGHLFRDSNTSDSGTILYVFITPYIMSDPSFQDMRLLTRGPQAEVSMPDGVPTVQPRPIEIIQPGGGPGL